MTGPAISRAPISAACASAAEPAATPARGALDTLRAGGTFAELFGDEVAA